MSFLLDTDICNDLIIAATAVVHGLTLVTHNVGHFSHLPTLALQDWLAPYRRPSRVFGQKCGGTARFANSPGPITCGRGGHGRPKSGQHNRCATSLTSRRLGACCRP